MRRAARAVPTGQGGAYRDFDARYRVVAARYPGVRQRYRWMRPRYRPNAQKNGILPNNSKGCHSASAGKPKRIKELTQSAAHTAPDCKYSMFVVEMEISNPPKTLTHVEAPSRSRAPPGARAPDDC